MVEQVEQGEPPVTCEIYEIRIKGTLANNLWSAWFDNMEIRSSLNGETLLVGAVADQSALYGLIARLRDLALPLISLRLIDKDSE